MQEEQAELARNFVNPHIAPDPDNPDIAADECPLGDLTKIPEKYKNPSPELYEEGGPLSRCGFIQLLGAFENDFRVGVITTDVGLYDNRIEAAPDGWGFRPQRGCLQPDGAPGAPGTSKLIRRADLEDDDRDNNDLALRFSRTLENISVWGSPYERGLDAMAVFLDPSSTRAPGCEGDLETFRRPDAQLVTIFLTDEEDCSHGLGGTFTDELAGEPQSAGPFGDLYASSAGRCYSDAAKLAPVDAYVSALRDVDKKAKVAVIGGLVPVGDDDVEARGCLADDFTTECWESEGRSNSNTSHFICSADPIAEPQYGVTEQDIADRAGRPCCVADPARRYLDFARALDEKDGEQKSVVLDSICNGSYLETMIKIAAFIGSTRFVDLAEDPQDGLILVSITRAGDDEATVLPRVDPEQCSTETGWYLEGRRRIVLCEDAIPGPGDKLSVRAKGRADSAACRAEEEALAP
jgi:hypothetical protein